MSVRSPKLWIALLSALAVVYLAVPWFERTSPGPLASVHQREPKLTGAGSCVQCHGGWFGSMTGACLHCHAEIGSQLTAGNGFHGVLGSVRGARCGLCHSDHHGEDFAMVNRQSFFKASVNGPLAFRHETVGFAMEGRHLTLACSECHAHADVAVLPKDGRRYLGLDQDCVTCHDDVHRGSMVLPCASCHGQESFAELHSTGHERHLPLIGGHANVECRACHARATPASLESLGSGRKAAPRECAACHESPHSKDFVQGVARQVSMKPGMSCVACHDYTHPSFRDDRLDVTSAPRHACSGFALDAPHDKALCKDCHPEDAPDFAARYPGRGADQCSSCHKDPHGGQFGAGPFAAKGCIGCHDRLRWEPHAFSVREHERASLDLTGRHLAIDCNKCHEVPRAGAPRVFRGTPHLCERCHPDAHSGFFEKVAADLGAAPHGTCAGCHSTTSFADGQQVGFDHERWTGFPIDGAHGQGACERCHERSAEPDRFARTFGRVADRFGPMQNGGRGCVPCHADPHQGGFDKPAQPHDVAGRIGCARCHLETSFRAFASPIDHGRWMGYPLEGVHQKLPCSSCHTPLRERDEHGRTWGRARGRQCSDCHADPHAGQFVAGGRNDCQRCHRSVTAFKDLTFRHETHSRFGLGDAHKGLACSACHKPVRLGEREVVRFRPLGTACADCHGEHEEPFRRRDRKGP